MHYSARSLTHSSTFDRDCEQLFGSLVVADQKLAKALFEIAHDLIPGVPISSTISAYSVENDCIIIVEQLGRSFMLQACVAIGSRTALVAASRGASSLPERTCQQACRRSHRPCSSSPPRAG
jgi:hypothetical protein